VSKAIMKKGTCFLFIFIFSALNFGCKKSETTPSLETGTLIDIEGNVYKTIKIGEKWWMAENLKAKKFRNGNDIPEISGSQMEDWKNATGAAYCQYNENPDAPGLLYNWLAATDSNNIAPQGWHLPTDEEWKELEMQLGMTREAADKSSWRGTHEGDKLKISGADYWAAYGSVWATNESGFSAMAGGCRVFDGTWSSPGGLFYMGFWWTSTPQQGKDAWYRYLDYKNPNVFRSHASKLYGFSIRCVKD
jgi:uncharacterized protein (TIGR02145 family)